MPQKRDERKTSKPLKHQTPKAEAERAEKRGRNSRKRAPSKLDSANAGNIHGLAYLLPTTLTTSLESQSALRNEIDRW